MSSEAPSEATVPGVQVPPSVRCVSVSSSDEDLATLEQGRASELVASSKVHLQMQAHLEVPGLGLQCLDVKRVCTFACGTPCVEGPPWPG